MESRKRFPSPETDSEASCSGSSSRSRSRSRRRPPLHKRLRRRRSRERSRRDRYRIRSRTRSSSQVPRPSTSRPNNEGTSETLISTLLEFMQSVKKDSNSERFPVMNVIPEFDPSKRNQTIHTWLSKVNECASIYGWTDKQIAYYALPKLVGLAQRWYQGLPSVKFSWSEWESKLTLAFPSEENYGQLLTEMLACRARFNDSLEEYFYDKMVLLNRCKIKGKDAIDCILFGIEDRSVRTSAEAAQFREPDKLLVYLRNVKANKKQDKSNVTMQAGTSDNKRVKRVGQGNGPRCYNCAEEGHPYFKCRQPLKRCETCHKVGHETRDCPVRVKNSSNRSDPTNDKSVLCVSVSQESDRKYFKRAVVDGHDLNCFIDFGSQCTMVKESVAKKLKKTLIIDNLPVLRGFGNSLVNCLGKCSFSIKIDSVGAQVDALVVPDGYLRESLLIGQTFTEQDHIVVYKTKSELKFLNKSVHPNNKIQLFISESVSIHGLSAINVHSEPVYNGDILVESSFNSQKEYQIIECITRLENGKGTLIIKALSQSNVDLHENTLLVRAQPCSEIKTLLVNRVERDDKSNPEIITNEMINTSQNFDRIKQLTNLLNQYRDCFAFQVNELGCVAGTEMNINLKDNTPVVYRPYRLSHMERKIVRDMVDELKDSGIVRDSNSEYASPILLVKKKSGDYRLCVDYRNLNKKTVKEHYPLPRIDDQLDNLSGNKYYTTLDLASGYYQIPMSETSRHLTAFITPDGHFEFNRMPFGLANAPSTFQRAINDILGNARFKEAFAYMDDVIIPSKTVEEGFQKLINTLELFRKAGLTLKLSKCNFFKESIDYLGFEVCENGVRPGKIKIDAVENFPVPSDQHRLRQFLGLASFFRRFIRGFSMIAQPLTRLLKKDVRWQWGDGEENAFQTLKRELVKRPVLTFFNPSHETQLHTDASKSGIAGILLQRPNKESPFSAVAYYSRRTSPEESRFTSDDLETLAVVASMQRFRVYLLGVPFTVVTDCNSLRATFEKRDMLPRVARWWGTMQEYDFNVVYKPGVTMSHVDALSRNPIADKEILDVLNVESDWIVTVQQSDPELQRIVRILNDPETKNIVDFKNSYIVRRGLLYKKTSEGERWVVPKGVRWQVLKANHDNIGHFAFDKTYDKIRKQYWFAKMRRFIKKYIDSCLECAHNKVPSGKKAGELHPIPKVDCPFHTIHVDHLGPFVRSRKGNSYLLLIIDAYTKFIMLYPVKSTKSVHSIKAIRNYFHIFSVSKRLVSDRGSSFTSKRFEEFLNNLGVKHILNAVATPRANGQIERYNRTVLAALSASNHGKPESLWDECVSEIQWGLNNTLNKGIGNTPAQALFGMNLVGTSDALANILNNESDNPNEINNERNHDKENEQEVGLKTVRNEISSFVNKNQTKQKERFDKKRIKVNFNVGDLVRVERDIPSTGGSRKLVSKIRGPYRIIEVLPNDRYIVEDTPLSRKGNRNFKGTFSVDKIHPWLVFNRNCGDSSSESNVSDE